MQRRMINTSQTTGKTNSSSNLNVEKTLIDNFIALQKVMTNLALKFEDLSTKIGKLLELFEISAKAIVEKDLDLDGGVSKKNVSEMSDKLDQLLNQNKVLAKGVSLLHEIPEHPSKSQNIPLELKKIQSVTPQSPKDFQKKRSLNEEDSKEEKEKYQKSISTKSERPNENQNQNFP